MNPHRSAASSLMTALSAVCILAACGRGAPGSVVVEEQLESGAVRLTYTELSLRFLEFEVEAVWDIWSPDAPYLFSEVTDVVGGQESFFAHWQPGPQLISGDRSTKDWRANTRRISVNEKGLGRLRVYQPVAFGLHRFCCWTVSGEHILLFYPVRHRLCAGLGRVGKLR